MLGFPGAFRLNATVPSPVPLLPACSTDASLREKMMDMEEPVPAATRGHVVLCGLNELGYRTLEELVRLGEHVVVVVRSPAEELARGARELGATLVRGSYRDQAVLRAAGVPVSRRAGRHRGRRRRQPACRPGRPGAQPGAAPAAADVQPGAGGAGAGAVRGLPGVRLGRPGRARLRVGRPAPGLAAAGRGRRPDPGGPPGRRRRPLGAAAAGQGPSRRHRRAVPRRRGRGAVPGRGATAAQPAAAGIRSATPWRSAGWPPPGRCCSAPTSACG